VHLAAAALGPSLSPLKRSSRALRNRPGERPTWIDASSAQSSWGAWREAAAEAGQPLDAAVSIAVEFELARGDLYSLGISEPVGLMVEAATADARESRLAPTPEIRLWIEQLEGRSQREGADEDELPEVVVPSRLVLLLGRRGFDTLVVPARVPAAIGCEVQAARRGLTLAGWALRHAMR
jgi:hypothetical protein